MKIYKFFVFVYLVVVVSSCQKEVSTEVIVDVREEALGYYTYQFEVISDGDHNNATITESVLEIELDEFNGLKMNFSIGTISEYSIFLVDITSSPDGFVFNVLPITDTDNPFGDITLIGYKISSLNGLEYHGTFNVSSKQLEFNMVSDGNNPAAPNIETNTLATQI